MDKYRLSDFIHIELTSRCRLSCPNCERTRFRGEYKIKDLPLELVFRMAENPNFNKIMLCGNLGDPIYHPNFFEVVQKIKESGKALRIVTNGSGKKLGWWEKIFNLLESSDVVCFGLDGLKDTAHIYRVNTNFQQVFEAMKLGTAIKRAAIEWQFIPINFNQHQIEEAKQMALKHGIRFTVMKSGRFKLGDSLLPDIEWLPEIYKKKLTN